MMRAMRENTKWVFYILVAAFLAWLIVDVGAGLTGESTQSDVVVKINGSEVHYPEYQTSYQAALDQIRQQNRSGPLTREDEQELQNQVVEQLIQGRLLRQAYDRLNLHATAQEIRDAARSTPPPELMQAPQFQTNGQFDPAKYQRFLQNNADPQFLLALESRYRDEIPRVKLAQYLTADIYVPDTKLWRIYRDSHDSITGQFVAIWPTAIPDAQVTVTDADLQRYLNAHEDDFKRPAIAYLSYVDLTRVPDALDSAATRTRVAELRAEVAKGGATAFADVAKRESADSGSAQEGGDLGWFKLSTAGLDTSFARALKRLRPGELSQPVRTQFGYHIIKVEQAKGDSVHPRHILIPFEMRPARRDTVENRADSLDNIAGNQTNGALLDSAAKRLGLTVASSPRLVEGSRMQLGRNAIPDVSVWAFEAKPGETSPVIDAPSGFYVFRLDSLIPAGVPPLDELRDALTAQARLEKKRTLLEARAQELFGELKSVPDLAAAATAKGLPAQTFGPLSRLNPPSYLSREPLVLGTAFGLKVGERSGLIKGEDGYYMVQLRSRRDADSTAWLAQRDTQRETLLQAVRQARIRAYMDGLRAQAKIVDRRKEIFRPATQAGA
jgi:peptidyl-prolyl cis-trans isomerase D